MFLGGVLVFDRPFGSKPSPPQVINSERSLSTQRSGGRIHFSAHSMIGQPIGGPSQGDNRQVTAPCVEPFNRDSAHRQTDTQTHIQTGPILLPRLLMREVMKDETQMSLNILGYAVFSL